MEAVPYQEEEWPHLELRVQELEQGSTLRDEVVSGVAWVRVCVAWVRVCDAVTEVEMSKELCEEELEAKEKTDQVKEDE